MQPNHTFNVRPFQHKRNSGVRIPLWFWLGLTAICVGMAIALVTP